MANRYWVGGSGEWNTTDTTHWSTSSGGSSGASVPTASDDVFFDGNSGGGIVGRTGTVVPANNLNFTGFTGTYGGSGSVNVSASFTAGSGMTWTNAGNLNFVSTSSGNTVTTNGVDFGNASVFIFFGVGGVWTLQDNIVNLTLLEVFAGTFNSNSKNINLNSIGFATATSSTKVITLGSSIITISASGANALSLGGTGLTFNANTSLFKFTDTSNTAITFAGGGYTFNDVWFSRGSSTGNITISGSNTFNDFKDDGTAAHSILFTAGINTTVTTWSVSGTAGNLISINSTTTGTHTLTKSSGTVSAQYLNIQHSVATGGATWNAINSTNNNSVATAGSGWVISAAPTVTTQAVSSITATGGTGNGDVTSDGGGTITERGVVVSTSPNPTTSDTKFTTSGTTGAYTVPITGLSSNTLYHVRAYAINASGTSYGSDVSFTTLAALPTVTTQAVSSVAATTATGNGNITATGGINADERGIVYNISSQSLPGNVAPAISGYSGVSNSTGSFGTGAFTNSLTGLVSRTTYYARAYAHNSDGYSYGSEVSFTTIGFTNPGNIYASDNTYATLAAVDGQLTVEVSKDGGANYGTALIKTFTGSDSLLTYGLGSTELWGYSWTRADMVNANFRVRLSQGNISQVYKTFGFATGTETLTGIEIAVEGNYNAAVLSLDLLKVKIYYGTSVLPVQAGSQAYNSTNATLSVYNGSAWTNLVNVTTATAGKILIGDGTNMVLSTPTFPNASATALKYIRSDGTNWIASTSTISDTPSTAGKVLISNGTNWITSTPTFPNASATTRKIIVSDGTNWIASTETYAVPGTSGNVLTSDGTNWTSATPAASLQTTTITLTATQVKSFFTTPITVIAGVASQVIQLVDILVIFTYGGVAMTAGGAVRLQEETSNVQLSAQIISAAEVNGTANIVKTGGMTIAVNNNPTRVAGKAVQISCANQDFATGNGTLKLIIAYNMMTP